MQTIIDKFEKLKLGKGKNTNCISTALFLVGVKEVDEFISPRTIYEDYLKNLETIESPQEGCLVAFHLEDFMGYPIYTAHMGVIIGNPPTQMIHRERSGGGVFHESLNMVEKSWKEDPIIDRVVVKVKYYLPPKHL